MRQTQSQRHEETENKTSSGCQFKKAGKNRKRGEGNANIIARVFLGLTKEHNGCLNMAKYHTMNLNDAVTIPVEEIATLHSVGRLTSTSEKRME